MMMSPFIDSRNLNALWASTIAETLYRCGLTTAIICPGSRSAPLTIAFAQHPEIETIPILDERSASFFALGIAKRTHRPVVLICSSGTAGANFYPAVIEAHESRVPLLVMTADRPPELRDCNSGQTITQQNLYSHFPNYHCELSTPELNLSRLQYVRQRSAQCYQHCLYPIAGPVHLNIPFRDPLAPIADPEVSHWSHTIPVDFFDTLTPFVQPQIHQKIPAIQAKRGIIIAGVAQPQEALLYAGAIADLAEMTGFPVLAEALSPVRNYSDFFDRPIISTYDTILRNSEIAEALKPDFVLRIGQMPTSKVLRQWLDQCQVETWIVDESDRSLDPLHGKARNILTSVIQFVDDLPKSQRAQDEQYIQAWETAEKQMRETIDNLLDSTHKLFEGKAAWLLPQVLPANTALFVSNSMPVRDMEYFWQPNDRQYNIRVNRGANGIDGCLSTALGIAHQNQPTIMLTGDLTLLYDTNGFLIRSQLQGHLTIILINNNGGGIFGMLPIAQFDPPFEEYFSTPQNIEFELLCQTYQIDHVLIRDWSHFSDCLQNFPSQGIRILELKCDRKFDAAWRKEIFASIAANLTLNQ